MSKLQQLLQVPMRWLSMIRLLSLLARSKVKIPAHDADKLSTERPILLALAFTTRVPLRPERMMSSIGPAVARDCRMLPVVSHAPTVAEKRQPLLEWRLFQVL